MITWSSTTAAATKPRRFAVPTAIGSLICRSIWLAGAFQTGLRFAAENGYDCAMQMDADGQHKPEYIAPMLAALEEGNDIVIGSRFLAVKKPKTLRMLGSYIISWSIRLTTGRAICDPTSGMRMFNRAMVEEFAQNLNYGPEPDTISYLIKTARRSRRCRSKWANVWRARAT